jgi:hypothetical protein
MFTAGVLSRLSPAGDVVSSGDISVGRHAQRILNALAETGPGSDIDQPTESAAATTESSLLRIR